MMVGAWWVIPLYDTVELERRRGLKITSSYDMEYIGL
jgi:hypothetical protein